MSVESLPSPAKREPLLSPVDRVSEMLFGLFMALTFVGAMSVTESGRDDIRAMLAAAIGCNLAWGLVDAVMYLVRTVADRGRLITLINAVRSAPDAASGRTLIQGSLSKVAAGLVSETEVEAIRGRVVALATVPGATQAEIRRLPGRTGRIPLGGCFDLSGRAALRFDRRRRHGEERVARHRARDAVLRRPCAGPIRWLRQLESRTDDDRARCRHRRRGQALGG